MYILFLVTQKLFLHIVQYFKKTVIVHFDILLY